MSSTEAYLDSLLKAALESEEKNARKSSNDSEDIENKEELENYADSNIDNGELEMVDKDTKEEMGHSLGEDEIAALFAEAGISQEYMEFGTSEKTVHENASEDFNVEQTKNSVPEEGTLSDEAQAKENIGEVAEEGGVLRADEIAALFAEAGIKEVTEELADEPIVEDVLLEDTSYESIALNETEVENEKIAIDGRMDTEENVDAEQVLGEDDLAALFVEAGIEEEPVASELEEQNMSTEEATAMGNGSDETLTELVETGIGDSDIADLLEIMSENNDELAEINDLLKKSDSDELADLKEETAQEQTPVKKAKKEKKKRKSLFERKNKSKDEAVELSDDEEKQKAHNSGEEVQFVDLEENKEQDNFVDLLSQLGAGDFTTFDEFSGVENSFEQQFDGIQDNGAGEFLGVDVDIPAIPDKKKKGLMATFFDWLTEEAEEEEFEEIKEKPKKNKKEKKGKKKEKNENEELMDELEAEDVQGKKGKKKKAKKIKIPKKQVKDLQEPEGKKIPVKRVIPVFVLCGSILLLLILVSNVLIVFTSVKSARKAYYNRDYETTYQNLIGKKLNENDQLILEKTTLIMSVQRKYDSYLNYVNLGNDAYACNALLSGYNLYLDSYELAEDYRITEELNSLKRLIVDALWNSYGISEEKAVELISIQDAEMYKESLNSILQEENSQTPSQSSETENVNMESDDLPEILAEEQEMTDQNNE